MRGPHGAVKIRCPCIDLDTAGKRRKRAAFNQNQLSILHNLDLRLRVEILEHVFEEARDDTVRLHIEDSRE